MTANYAVMSWLVYMISVWGRAQQYLLQGLQVQQLAAGCRLWSRGKLLGRVGCLSIRQLIFFHTVIQAQKIISVGKPAVTYESISTHHPYRTRNASNGRIRFGETFNGGSTLTEASFRNRAVHMYNQVPASVLQGRQLTVKHKLREWVRKSVPIDWG